MALKVSGKDERLDRADFKLLATTIGLRDGDAVSAIDHLLKSMRSAVETITMPDLPARGAVVVATMLEICRARIASLE